MDSPLVLLNLGVAAGLALFAVALAAARRPAPLGRGPLLGLLVVATALVLRGGLLGLGLWSSGPVELPLALAGFLALPALLALAVEAIAAPGALGRRWAAALGLGPALALVGGWALFAARGGASLSPLEWQAFVGGLVLQAGLAAVAVRSAWPASGVPRWLRSTVSLFAAHWALSTASWAAGAFGVGGAVLGTALEAGSLVTLLGFGAVAVVRALGALPGLQPPAAAPYAGSGLGDRARRQRADALREHMGAEQPYLRPDLSAGDLSDALGLTPRELSEILNVELGQGFFEFVNGYRVREAQRRLAHPAHADDTVLEILYASGFNSKSAFHRAFRANVGMTPSAYREQAVRPRTAQAA